MPVPIGWELAPKPFKPGVVEDIYIPPKPVAPKKPEIPSEPPKEIFFTGPEFEEVFGVGLPSGWDASYMWDETETAPTVSVYAPGGVKVALEDIGISPTGEWVYGEPTISGLAIREDRFALPEGTLPVEERLEYFRYQAQLRLEDILSEVFITDAGVEEARVLAGEDPDVFIDAVAAIGRNDATEDLLLEMGLTEEDLDMVFGAVLPELPTKEPDAVFMPLIGQIKQLSAEEKEKAPTWVKAFASGVGDIYSAVAGVARRFGFDDIGTGLSKEAERMHREYFYPDTIGDFEFADLLNPDFYAEKIVRTIPFALSLAPLAVGGYFAGAALSRPLESAMEAGNQYDDAIARGKTEKEASEEFDRVFSDNMLLIGADAFEIAIALAPTPKWVPGSLIKGGLVRTIRIGGKMVIVGLSEGGEEVYQDLISRRAKGEEWQWDPISKEVFAIGMVMGLGMGLGGDVITNIVNRSKEAMPADMKRDFDGFVEDFKKEGFLPDQAELRALDVISQTPEGQSIIARAIEGVKRFITEERGAIGRPEGEEVTPEERLVPLPDETKAEFVERNLKGIGKQRAGNRSILKTMYDRARRLESEAKPPAVEGVTPEVTPPAVEVEVRRQLSELQKMSDIWSKKLADREQVKSQLAKFARENLPQDVRGKFITSVAKVKTDAQLQIQIAKVSEVAELNAQKVIKAEIQKELKKAQTKIKDHILKGKFTPEVQRRLDTLTHNLKLDRDAAREKMAENITAYEEGKLGYDEMLNDNEMLNFAGLDGMSAEELANTLEYIRLLETIGKSARQAKQEKATERINIIRSAISKVLTGGQGLKTGVGAVPTGELAAKTGWWDTFVNWQYGIDNLADKLSKFDPTTKPYQSALSQFMAAVHRATNGQITGTRVAFNKVKDLVGETYRIKGTRDINQALNSLDEEVNLGVFELTEEYKANHPSATTITLKMTRDQLIAKYMQMQDPTLNDTFITGMGWSQKVRDVVSLVLTPEEKRLADGMFGFYEEYYTATNEIYQELFNVDMPHNPVYSPIRRDFEADIVENILTMRDASQYASVLNGSLKARQRNVRPLKFNGALEILSNHIQQMEHFKAWATTMRDMRRVFGNKEIRLAVDQYHGRGALKLIDTFLNQMARGGIETAATNRAADFLRRNFTKSILAIKPVILLKQIPSLFGYVSEMNTVDFFVGIADFWTNPVANFKFLYANSEMFKARMSQGFERDIRAAMEKHGKNLISGRGKFTDWFLLQIRLGDTFAVTQGMWAKYKAGLKEGLSQEAAVAAAEDTTGRTQPSFGIDTLSAIQNGGSWLKLMTMFQNQPNKYFRMTSDNLRNFKYGRGSRAKAASTILLTWCILPMMFQYIADAFQWKPERQARAGILGPLNFILIAGQLVQSMWGWLTDMPFDYQVSPVAQTGRDLQMIFQKAKKLVEQGLDPFKDISGDDVAALIEYLAKAAGQVLGLPTPYFVQLSKLLRHKFAAGEELQIKDFLFSEWALTPPDKTAEEKVEDLSLKLGEVKEGQEDKPLTEKELKIYTTVDWFREMGSDVIYGKTLPQDILDDKTTSKESRAWAEYAISRSKADIIPNKPLYKINTGDNADTIVNYYQQWLARQKITNLADLKEFDKLYPKAYMGNVTRQQYNLLVRYLNSDDKVAFLRAHPELRINPRDEWLKANPLDNARLALGGRAKILSLDAYNEVKKLINELDIPNDAVPDRIGAFDLDADPAMVEAWTKRGEIVDEFGAGSTEAKLWLIENPDIHKWALDQGLLTDDGADWNENVLNLRILTDELDTKYDDYGNSESALYIEDEELRGEARDKLKADNPEWVDNMRRIDGYSKGVSEGLIEKYTEYYRLPRAGYDQERFLMENEDYYNDVWLGVLENQPKDFDRIPSVEVEALYEQWQRMDLGKQRRDFEAKYPELDQWLHLTKGTMLETER